jgi:hypothetical protein
MRRVAGVNRFIALVLAFLWLSAGVAGIAIAIRDGNVLLGFVALFALFYATLWLRVSARSRLLTWTEVAMPWRAR